jgi:SAM-dependent methyltransferase
VSVLSLEELPDETFDFVNSEQVFEHLVDPRETLRRLARSLKPGGWLKIAVPDGSGIADRLQQPDWTSRALNPVAPLEHLNAFDQEALTELGRQASLARATPPPTAMWSATVGLWPPRRLLRGVARPLARRVAPGAAFFRRLDSSTPTS